MLSVIISCLGSTKSGLSVKSFVIYHSVESTYREVRSGALKSKGLQVKVKKRKMMIISENEEGKFVMFPKRV